MKLLYSLLLIVCCSALSDAQITNSLWTDKPESDMRRPQDREIIPEAYRTIGLDVNALRNALAQAPQESVVPPTQSPLILSIPAPDGGFDKFRVVEYQMMQAELQARYPEMRTYRGVSVEDPFKTVRFSWTVRGLSVMVSGGAGKYFIDPYARRNQEDYISYFKSDYLGTGAAFECHVEGLRDDIPEPPQNRVSGDCTFRSYRLAVAAAGEYSNFHDAMSSADEDTVLSAIVIAIDRVNEVYERDVAIRMILIAQTTDVFYYDPNTDPFSGSSCNQRLQNQTAMDDEIGSSNYDIGHVFSVGGGGCASLGVPCTSSKAHGATALTPPIGDPFYIDYVAHEIGHQFGGNHTQNNGCNRNSSTAYEPGSASTIMGYAGICSPDVQSNSDDYFHGISVQEINTYTGFGNGDNCDLPIAGWSNNAPVIAAGSDYTIPISTPFMLIADATDADGDPLNYLWEQWDQEVGSMPPSPTNSVGPMFRSFDPSPDPIRYFPRLSSLVNNVSPTWEVLASVSRNMDFRVTVKDFHNGMAGCADEDNVNVTTSSSSGPFLVTLPDTGVEEWTELATETVTWDVAGTDLAPVSCANVDIILSYDGGLTYPDTLASGVANTGTASVVVPAGVTTTARVMVKCSDNIFFDISNEDFEIVVGVPDFTLTAALPNVVVCHPDNAEFMINVGSIAGFGDDVTLSALGVPVGANANFSVNPVTPGETSQLTISGLGGVALGDYMLTIEGTSTTGPKSTGVSLTLTDIPEQVTLNSPPNMATDVDVISTLQWSAQIGAASYAVQVASDPAFAILVESDTVPGNMFTTNAALAPLTTYYWRVRAQNICGTGLWSEAWEFETRPCFVYTSDDVPKDLPPNGPGNTASSIITILDSGTITDLNVINLEGEHDWMNDLDVFLISPASTSVELFTDICSNLDDFDLDLDDEAGSGIPCPPTDGMAHTPEGDLSDFDGEDINGTWALEITDDYPAADDGVLQTWSIEICMNNYSCNKTVFNLYNEGPGSLRAAIDCAEDGDTVLFDAAVFNSTITLNSTLTINKDIVIQSSVGQMITISGAGLSRAIEVTASADAEIEGVTILSGTGAVGAGIINQGNLLLRDITITASPGAGTLIENNGGLTLEGTCDVSQ